MDPNVLKNLSLMLSRRAGVSGGEHPRMIGWPEYGQRSDPQGSQGYPEGSQAVWYVDRPVGAPFIKAFTSEVEERGGGILIHAGKVTFDSAKKLAAMKEVQVFDVKYFSFDLMAVVPDHSLWKRPGDEGYPEKTEQSFPKIMASDPVCRYHGFRPRDLVHVKPHDVYIVC
ncbi:hypothetical protein [Lumpfish ranavirus]|uniref:Uncharacterized protein n=1 Tax=Lumpfish ranavirus TaxID=2501771 RepID=A0A3Q9TA40_9VIRU|nr:hypothetical protein QKE36_gp65 [Lumpfish ranavirus]AZY88464.1 hypothetical protein [Lumpfish ranavirus]